MCLSKDAGGRRCPCSGGVMPVPTTKEEREERATFLVAKRSANATAADRYRARQLLMVREATALVHSLDRVPADERAAAITRALEELPERGAIQPRRVLEAALEKEWVPVPVTPVVSVPAPVPVTTNPETDTETEPETETDYDPEAEHERALSMLNDRITAIREQEDAANAARVAAAMEAVADAPNPFEGLSIPEPDTEPTVSVDEAYAAHMAREAAEEERQRVEQERRDAAPRKAQVKVNPFEHLRKPQPAPKVNPFEHLRRVTPAQNAEK